MSEINTVVTSTPSRFESLSTRLVVGAMVAAPLMANADVGTALDMSDATGTLVLALAAIGALGAAKLAPAALTWVWGIVTGMAKRG